MRKANVKQWIKHTKSIQKDKKRATQTKSHQRGAKKTSKVINADLESSHLLTLNEPQQVRTIPIRIQQLKSVSGVNQGPI